MGYNHIMATALMKLALPQEDTIYLQGTLQPETGRRFLQLTLLR